MARHFITRNNEVGQRIHGIAADQGYKTYIDDEGVYADNVTARDFMEALLANLQDGADVLTAASWTKTPAGWGVAVAAIDDPQPGQKIIAENRWGRRELVTLAEPVKVVFWEQGKMSIFEVAK